MKNIKIFACITLMMLVMASCKKDYPKDIPKWLKERIKELKKDEPDCLYGIQISEFKNSSSGEIIFYFSEHFPSYSSYYDYNGNLLCYTRSGVCCIDVDTNYIITDTCENRLINDFIMNRIIFSQNCQL